MMRSAWGCPAEKERDEVFYHDAVFLFTGLFSFRGPVLVEFAVLTVIFAGRGVAGRFHLVFGFEEVDLKGLGAGVAGFLDPFL